MKHRDSVDIENQAIPYWKEYYKKIFNTKNIIDVRNKEMGYDVKIITDTNNIFKIDEKTRSIDYYKVFRYDKMILIETKGNIEYNKNGSSIFNSNADCWAYGWLGWGNKNIVHPILFNRKPIAEYIKKNKEELEIKISNTNKLYHTENVLVPYYIIKKYQINKKNNQLIKWL